MKISWTDLVKDTSHWCIQETRKVLCKDNNKAQLQGTKGQLESQQNLKIRKIRKKHKLNLCLCIPN